MVLSLSTGTWSLRPCFFLFPPWRTFVCAPLFLLTEGWAVVLVAAWCFVFELLSAFFCCCGMVSVLW